MTRIRQMGEATVQQRKDGGAVKLSTFIPLHEPDLVSKESVADRLGSATGSRRSLRSLMP